MSDDRKYRVKLTRLSVEMKDNGFLLLISLNNPLGPDPSKQLLCTNEGEVIARMMNAIQKEKLELATDKLEARTKAKEEGKPDPFADDDIPF